MNKIDKNELFDNLRGFLKSKGIALQDGSYTNRLKQGCGLLATAINTTQTGVARARGKVNSAMDHLKRSIRKAAARRNSNSSHSKGSGSAARAKGRHSPKRSARKSSSKHPRRRSS